MNLHLATEQRLAPLRDKPAGHLLVHEIYRSIQGESTFAGLPCVFVRLTACMARCSWCDKLMGAIGGSIINVSSIVGPMPVENASVYSATKAAVDAVTIALSKELGPKKIRVNSLNPGMVETEGLHAAGIAESDFRKTVEAQTPLGRIGRPEDIARVAVFYASDEAAWVTGQTLVLAGGQRQ